MDDQARLSLYRPEVTLTAGPGKLRTPAGLEHGLKESLFLLRGWVQVQIMSLHTSSTDQPFTSLSVTTSRWFGESTSMATRIRFWVSEDIRPSSRALTQAAGTETQPPRPPGRIGRPEALCFDRRPEVIDVFCAQRREWQRAPFAGRPCFGRVGFAGIAVGDADYGARGP
jgi:hypothetical protein